MILVHHLVFTTVPSINQNVCKKNTFWRLYVGVCAHEPQLYIHTEAICVYSVWSPNVRLIYFTFVASSFNQGLWQLDTVWKCLKCVSFSVVSNWLLTGYKNKFDCIDIYQYTLWFFLISLWATFLRSYWIKIISKLWFHRVS